MSRSPNSAVPALLCVALLASPGLGIAQTSPGQTAATTASGSLGDLSPFRAIAHDTLRIVKTGDLVAAKNRITDLETAWDEAQDQLRARNREKWIVVDKAIDRALENLRSPTPNAAASREALQNLVTTMDAVQKQG